MRLGAKARRNCLFFSSGLFRAVWDYGWEEVEEVEEARGGQMEEEEEEGRMEMERLVYFRTYTSRLFKQFQSHGPIFSKVGIE